MGRKPTYEELEQQVRELEKEVVKRKEVEKRLVDLTKTKEALRISEKRLRLALEGTTDGIWDWNLETGEVYFSPRYYTMLGYEPDEFPPSYESWRQRLYPADAEVAERAVQQAIEDHSAYAIEFRFKAKNGEWRWILGRGKVVESDEEGKAVRMAGSHTDITERKEAEKALRESEALFSKLSEATWEAIIIHDRGMLIQANDQYYQMFGYDPAELLGEQAISMTATPESVKTIRKYINSEKTGPYEVIGIRKDGTKFPMEIRGKMTEYAGKKVRVAAIRDITERKQAEEALRREKHFSDTLIESMPGVFCVIDEQGRLVQWNKRFESTTGYFTEEIHHMKPLDFFAGEEKDYITDKIQEVFTKGETEAEADLMTKGGRKIPYYFTGLRIFIDDNPHVIGVGLDISDRKRAESQSARLQVLLKSVIMQSPVPMVLALPDGTVELFNDSCRNVLGLEDELDLQPGLNLFTLAASWKDYDAQGAFIPLTESPLAKALQGKTTRGREMKVMRKNGTERWILVDAVPVCDESDEVMAGFLIFPDITELKQAEEALEKRIVALTQPLDSAEGIVFEDLFNLSEIQRLQDLYAEAFGVAALITRPDGTPITQPSNFSELCGNIIRKNPKAVKNCNRSDAMIGQHNPAGPNIQPCLSAGLCNAGASITVGGHHMANWLIGQVRNEAQKEEEIMEYAREIGADETAFRGAYRKVPVMSQEQFERVAHVLFELANQISRIAYQNVQQARFIAERKRAEGKIRESEEKYRLLFDTTEVLLSVYNREGVCQLINRRVAALFGGEPEDFIGKSIIELHPEDGRDYLRSFRETMDSGVTLEREDEVMFPQGSRWLLTRLQPLPDEQGVFRTVQIISQDITERKQAEEAIRESEQFTRTIVTSVGEGVIVYDRDLRYRLWNAFMEDLTGSSEKEVLGKCALDIFPHLREQGVDKLLEKALGGETVFAPATPYYIPGTEKKGWVLAVYSPHISVDGEIIGVVETVRDITELKQAEEALKTSERNYQEIFNASKEAIFVHDMETGAILDVNQTMCEMFGYTREEAVKLDVGGLSQGKPPYTMEDARLWVGKAIEEGPQRFEWLAKRKSGELFWDETVLKHAVIDGQDRILAFVSDITERKRADEALRESAEQYRIMTTTSMDGFAVVDSTTGRFLDVNEAYIRMLGYSREEHLALSVSDIEAVETPDKIRERIQQLKVGPARFESRHRCKDGRLIDVEVSMTLLPRAGKVLCFVRDITERLQAEAKIRESEEKYRLLFDSSEVLVSVYDRQGICQLINRRVANLFDGNPEDFIGKSFKELHPEVGEEYIKRLRETIDLGISNEYEDEIKFPRGKRWLLSRSQPVADAQGLIRTALIISQDITERKQAEEEMDRLRKYLQNIVNSMPSVVVGIDSGGKITQWNLEAEKVTSIAGREAQGRALLDVLPQLSGEMEKVRQAIRERKPLTDTRVVTQINDEKRFSDITIYPLMSNGEEGAVIRIDDVTERVRLEEMMIQSEKMLSVGGLAAGMAHEINNPLASILQNAQVVLLRTSKDLPANQQAAAACGTGMETIYKYMEKREILKMLDAIRVSGERAAEIVKNMLSFSRKSGSAFLPHMLSDLLDNTVALASSDYDLKKKYDFRQIEIVREYDSDIPKVVCGGTEIQQVVLNLLRNAAESMAGKKEHAEPLRITLRTLKEGDMVRIEVEDNGTGMEEDVRRRVFEPFFTTKEPGAGTGLGLSVSYFIITENHGGTMEAESAPGRGTKFIIRLPLGKSE